MLQGVAKKKENIWGLSLSDWGQIPALPPLMLCDLCSLSRSINPGGGHRPPRVLSGRQAWGVHLREPGASTNPFAPAQPWHGGCRAGLLRLSATGIRGLVGAALCGAAPPASTHHGPGAHPAPSCDHPKRPQM